MPLQIVLSLTLGAEHLGQEKLIESEVKANQLPEETYRQINDKTAAAGGEHGIDKVLPEHDVDVIIGPADSRIPDVTALARRSRVQQK